MQARAIRKAAVAMMMLAAVACRSKEEAKEEEAKPAAADGIVALSEGSLKNMDLKIMTAAVGTLGMKLSVPGRISADANRTAKVAAQLEGRVSKLDQDVGDRVAQGAVMGTLETPELLDKPLVLRAPVSGVVTEKSAAVGELVEKGRAIYEISDPARLWLIGEVKEKDVALVRAGQKVEYAVPAYPGKVFSGTIARVGTAVETDTRTFEIRVEVDNRDGKLKPGMFADLGIVTQVVRDALLIDDAALQTDGDDQVAFVALDGNRFEKRKVKVGLEEDGKVQVLDGIKSGEKVVTEGSFTLKSELLKGELGEE